MLKTNLVDFAKEALAFGLGVGVAISPGIQSDPRRFVSAFALVFLVAGFGAKVVSARTRGSEAYWSDWGECLALLSL